MDTSRQILSNIITYMKYARYDKKQKRRETWEEIIDRYKKMMIKKYPKLKDEIEKNCKYLYNKKVLPSARALQFAGKAIEKNPIRNFNCSYLPMDNSTAFQELIFVLLSGTGAGFSVQYHHIDKLPEIHKPKKKRRYLVGDSIEGWTLAVGALIDAYMGDRKSLPLFDFSDIREKGTPLKTSGGAAPGPSDLKVCMVQLQNILDSKTDGERLTSLEILDMCCHIASCVVSGGIRRSSMLALFSFDDEKIKFCKTGTWPIDNPQRAMVNISAAILRHKIKKEEFDAYFDIMKNNRTGEPGIFWTNDCQVYGTNPCGEASLKAGQFCNLTSINTVDIKDQSDFNNRATVASFFGTLQAGFTDFHLLREFWKEVTEKDALIGVSLAGIAAGNVLSLNVKEGAERVVKENERVASLININPASRTCLQKPDGTISSVLACSSGVHAYHSEYYIRRIRVLKTEAIYMYLKDKHPELLEDDKMKPTIQAVISIPVNAPENAITRQETALQLLSRVKRLYKDWVLPGHRKGQNTHSISCTVTVKKHEWDKVKEWMWNNREHYASITVFPYEEPDYPQLPFEEVTEGEYNKLFSMLKKVDLTKVTEYEDNTQLQYEVACGGGACEIV